MISEKIGVAGKDYHGHKLLKFDFEGREAIIVEPANPRDDMQWIWKAEFFEAFPKFEIAMLGKGFYLAYIDGQNTFGAPKTMELWERYYSLLTGEYGLCSYPVMLGLSRGGLYVYNWAARNPDKVGCVYADNPVCDFKSWPAGKGNGPGSPADWEKLLKDYGFASENEALAYRFNPVDSLKPVVEAGIPLIHAATTEDEVVPIAENTDVLEANCNELGGSIRVIRHPGLHHPHGLDDPSPVIDFILENNRGCFGN